MNDSQLPSFFNLYTHGFVRVSVAVPVCKIADPHYNAEQTLILARQAASHGVVLTAFPELGISAYTCDDLFHQRALLTDCLSALDKIVLESNTLTQVLIVGIPLLVDHQLYNCAVVIAKGAILGVVPKSYLPNYGEFYEARQFSPASHAISKTIKLGNQWVPFGAALLFEAVNIPLFKFHVEICEDVWVPVPPSTFGAMAGALVLVNLSASNILIGKSRYRHQLVSQQSARCRSAYLYTSAGQGESTTDMAWDSQSLIYQDGELLAESERFINQSHLIYADIDLDRLSSERMRQTTFGQTASQFIKEIEKFQTIRFELFLTKLEPLLLTRCVERFPYVPAGVLDQAERCEEVYNIQVQALVQRLSQSKIQKVVIGVSGGLDSTHALLVCVNAMEKLKLPRTNILAYTMPGFATSSRTLLQAHSLMTATGCSAAEIDIRPSCLQMLKDLNHPHQDGKPVYDITFENVQAGERTSHLFRLANLHHALVIGTGDLSELALGWCTYGVGDHMSHYNVNASVPKTLIAYLVRWAADSRMIGQAGSDTLIEVLSTDISPELVPNQGAGNQPQQKTENVIGSYELQDFNLYYTLRFGFSPPKTAFLAYCAWHSRDEGVWPEGEHVVRNQYDMDTIKHCMSIFLDRFFRTSQFKRSCVPNGPKIGSGGSLSPRGDWRAPSDSEATVWLNALATIPNKGI